MLLYIEKVITNRTEFQNRVHDIAARLGFEPDWLMLVMWIECRLDHKRINSISGASGLIQFMPSTALKLGTTLAAIRAMSNIQQLEYVYKFLLPYKGRIKTYLDLYLAVFFPLKIGMPLDTTVQSKSLSAGLIASQNKGYDLNHDGKITLSEISTVLLKQVPKSFADTFQLLKKKSLPEEFLS